MTHERFASVLWPVIVGALMFVPAVSQGRWWLALAAFPIGGSIFLAHLYNRRKGVPPIDERDWTDLRHSDPARDFRFGVTAARASRQ